MDEPSIEELIKMACAEAMLAEYWYNFGNAELGRKHHSIMVEAQRTMIQRVRGLEASLEIYWRAYNGRSNI